MPALTLIQERLTLIVVKLHDSTCSSDSENIGATAESLIFLAQEVYRPLVEAKHRVLFHTLRDAGLALWAKAREIHDRDFTEADKAYFTEVHDVLKDLCEKIETGEYYNELVKIRGVQTQAVV